MKGLHLSNTYMLCKRSVLPPLSSVARTCCVNAQYLLPLLCQSHPCPNVPTDSNFITINSDDARTWIYVLQHVLRSSCMKWCTHWPTFIPTHFSWQSPVILGIHPICKMFSIRNFFSMVVLLAVSTRIVNAFKSTSSRWMRTSTVSMNADAVSGEKINKIVDLESPKVVSTIALNAGEKCVVCRCWKRFVD